MAFAPLNPQENPLATKPIGVLLPKFAIPAIISFLVSALYNIVDQIFIGQGVGLLGNAATNVAFPITTISTAMALLLGIGAASNFNLRMGAGKHEEARGIIGTGVSAVVAGGVGLAVLLIVFLKPLLSVFGATPEIMPYAQEYTQIITLGLPFVIFATAASHMIRADGSPTYSMVCQMSGALVNILLDWLFVMVFHWGMAGAAAATVIGQMLSAGIAVRYFFHFRSVELTRDIFRIRMTAFRPIVALGAAACFNQLSMTVVQITMNNVLRHYGSLSGYGSEIPLACVGIITKVNMMIIGIVIGIAQGCQPIVGFNYGARNFVRVKKTYFTGIMVASIISIAAFICFQFFPRQIVSIFGQGSEEYFHFAEQYFRIFLFMTFANGLQPVTANFFTSIGKAQMGIFVSMTRQIIFLIPLVLIFPMVWGIDGVMYAGPIADAAAMVLAAVLLLREVHIMNCQIKAQTDAQEKA